MNDNPNIVVCNPPEEANYGTWLLNHPDCDTVIQHIGTGATILIYAYAKNASGNEELEQYRDSYMPDYDILMGVSEDGIRSVI